METCKPLSKRGHKKSQCVTFVHLWVIFNFLPTKLHYVYSPQPLRSRDTSCSHILWYIAGDLVMESKSVMTNVQDIKNMFISKQKRNIQTTPHFYNCSCALCWFQLLFHYPFSISISSSK